MVASEATLRTYEVGPYPSQVFRHPCQADRLAVEGNSAVAGRDAVFAANLIDAYLWVFVCLFHDSEYTRDRGCRGCRGYGSDQGYPKKIIKSSRGVRPRSVALPAFGPHPPGW